ncbi:MAG TPA: choice-of-anchor A family protein, partial [Isosphaeraceae bacterium]|nr:choice-of-anchor A family protein [Isosphaeraceae bacterium]
MKRLLVLLPALIIGLTRVSLADSIAYSGLGPAQNVNIYVLGDFSESNTDAGGNGPSAGLGVAVGGNFAPAQNGSFTVHGDVTVGGNYTNGGATIDGSVYAYQNASFSNETIQGGVYVGNNVTISGGSAPTGGVYYTGSASVPSYYQYLSPNPLHQISSATFQASYQPIHFTSANAYLQSESTYLDSLATTLGVSYTKSGSNDIVTLSGTGQSFYDFQVDASQFSKANTFVINVTGVGGQTPTVVVDVVNGNGNSAVQFPSLTPTLNGLDPQYLLYNFAISNPLNTNHAGILGSVLAPFSDVNFNGGNINGTLIAGNLSGTGEAHAYQFLGTLPTDPSTVAVPEPSALALLSSTIPALLAGLYLRRRMTQARDQVASLHS